MRKTKKVSLKRKVNSFVRRQRLEDPLQFLSPQRLDLAAKTIFARAYLEKNQSKWPEYVYREHIRAFNNFYEADPEKKSFEDFKNSFIKTIDGIGNDTWKHLSPVPVNGNYIVNGAHRVAASIVSKDKVNTAKPEVILSDIYNHDFFKSNRGTIHRIDEDVLDYMTIEYVTQKKNNIFVAIVFPTAEGHRERAYEHFLKLGEIVNMKTFKHDDFVGKEVIKQLYFNSNNDEWNYGLDFDSAKYKADLCFDGKEDMQVYVIEANLDETTRIKEKKFLRDLWGKDKHSIHITDTMDEANRVVRMFFNENSRRFLKVDRIQEFNSRKMYDLFNQYIEHAPKDYMEREKFAIEGSAVFDLLNIRDGKDIDYIARNTKHHIHGDDIELHDSAEHVYHSSNLDDILSNPQYFFYYKGYKFIDIREMYSYKKRRAGNGDVKDSDDLLLLSRFIKNNPQYSQGAESLPDADTEEPVVSIIVPVFNTNSELLKICLDSIKNQTYKNIEVIIVDDGSNKETATSLDAYVSGLTITHAWKVLHQHNQGLSAARNAGFQEATGKYVQFLDSDDYFDQDLIKIASGKAEDFDADVVVENFLIEDYQTKDKVVVSSSHQFPNKQTFTLDDLTSHRFETIPFNVWSKLFRRDFLIEKDILHNADLKRSEDVLFSYSALLQASRISFVQTPLITYRENLPVSNSNSNDNHPNDSAVAWQALYDKVTSLNMYSHYKNDFEAAMLGSIYWHYIRLKTPEGRKSLSEASQKLFTAIQMEQSDVRRLEIELGYSHSYAIELVRTLQSENEVLKKHIHDLNVHVNNLNNEIHSLAYPSIKKSVRKVGGAVKRRVKRQIGK